jgi:glycolate oxidase FAD binding subunit
MPAFAVVDADTSNTARELCDAVSDAAEHQTPLRLQGGNSKHFLGRTTVGTVLDTRRHSGVVDYHPSELVVTARAGTLLVELEAALAENRQMLPFEPPHFGPGATLGGALACALSGPRRPYAGAVRDFVLGVRLIDGRGRLLRFGGQVIKNVAGYDVSRLVVGAMGTLGLIVEASLKVLPRPAEEATIRLEYETAAAISAVNNWMLSPLPISATCIAGGELTVRLSGSAEDVRATRARLGGVEIDNAAGFWSDVREHRLDFFRDAPVLWRLSVPPPTPPLRLPGRWLIEWNGAQRWLATDASTEEIRHVAAAAGGHANLFRTNASRDDVFHPLAPGIEKLHLGLKAAFDPHRILNPGRLYETI